MSANRGSRVLLLGYGEMGHAMQGLPGERRELQVWNRCHVADLPPVSLEEAAAQAEFVLYCVPVTPLGELAGRVLPHLPEPCVSSVYPGAWTRRAVPRRRSLPGCTTGGAISGCCTDR